MSKTATSPRTGRPGLRQALGEPLPLAIVAVAFAGLFSAGVLSAGHLLKLPVPCGAGRGCLAVAMHPSSRVLGVPIAFVGVAAYATIVLLAGPAATSGRARVALVGLAVVGTAVSAWLLYYAHAVIQATCWWCVASGGAMALLLVLSAAWLVLWLRTGRPSRPVPSAVVLGLGLFTAVAVGTQAGLMQRASLTPPIPAARLAGLTESDLVDPAKTLGPAEAPVTIVVFADLQCPACRADYASLVRFQKAYPEQVRLAFRHLPLWGIRGHQFSGTAAALSQVAAEKGQFWPFVDAVYGHPGALDGKTMLGFLDRLGVKTGGVESRLANLDDPAVAAVRRDMDLADRLGVQATPTFVVLRRGRPPVSANQRTLPMILRSTTIPSDASSPAHSHGPEG